jgi:hypothetical protein
MPTKIKIAGTNYTFITPKEIGTELAKTGFQLGIRSYDGIPLGFSDNSPDYEKMEKFLVDVESLDPEIGRYFVIALECMEESNERRKEFEKGHIVGRTDISIEEYVGFRRKFPNGDRLLELDAHNYLNRIILAAEQLNQFGIDKLLVMRALDHDPKESWQTQEMDSACDELALVLLEKIIERKSVEESGETHAVGRGKAIPDSLVNEVALLMLASCAWDEFGPPFSLAVLLRAQLDRLGISTKLDVDVEPRQLAAVLLKSAPKLSIRKIAKAIGVAPSSVSRWQHEPSFPDLKERVAEITGAEKLVERLIKRRK